MAETDTLRIPVATLEPFVARIFEAAGCSPAEAARVARYLVAANLTGHDSHGVVRVPRYVEMLANGGVIADRTVETVFENDAMAVIDPMLRVHGIERLRVCDSSIMPEVVSSNTNAPTIAIAEKAADLIRGNR